MTTSPWSSDVDLSETSVENLIASQFPELEPVQIRTLAEGWDGKTFEVSGRWVFRFPKRSDVAASLETEVELLPALARALPVAVPAIAYLGRASSLFPYSFVGYPKIPGTEARRVRRRSVRPTELARELAAMLGALHAFPAATARACGVGTHSPARDLSLLRDHARELFTGAKGELPDTLAQRTERFLDPARPLPDVYTGEPVLAHNELGAEHLLIDETTGALTGVIDWGDVGLGDPAIDLAGLYAWLGAPLLDAVAAAYPHPLDAAALERARFVGVCMGIFGLAHGTAIGDRERSAAGVHTLSFAAADGALPT